MATATERVRRYRDRKRRGVEVVSIEVNALAIWALAYENYLSPDDTDDQLNVTNKAGLAEAVQAYLSDSAEGVAAVYDAAEAAGEV